MPKQWILQHESSSSAINIKIIIIHSTSDFSSFWYTHHRQVFSAPLSDNASNYLSSWVHYPKEIHRNSILVAANVLLYSHMHMIEREMRTYDSLIHNGFFVWATPFIEPEKGWCRLVLFLELSMRRKPRQMTTKKEQEQQESTCYLPT